MCPLYLNKAGENKNKTYLGLPEAYPYQFSNLFFTEKSSQNSFYMTSSRYLIHVFIIISNSEPQWVCGVGVGMGCY